MSPSCAEGQRSLADVFPVGASQKQSGGRRNCGWLKAECGLDRSRRRAGRRIHPHGRAVLGAVPTQDTIIAERFFDEGGGMQLVIHAPFGATDQQSLGPRAAQAFLPQFNFELQAAATDNGIEHRAGRAAQFSAGRCLPIPAS